MSSTTKEYNLDSVYSDLKTSTCICHFRNEETWIVRVLQDELVQQEEIKKNRKKLEEYEERIKNTDVFYPLYIKKSSYWSKKNKIKWIN